MWQNGWKWPKRNQAQAVKSLLSLVTQNMLNFSSNELWHTCEIFLPCKFVLYLVLRIFIPSILCPEHTKTPDTKMKQVFNINHTAILSMMSHSYWGMVRNPSKVQVPRYQSKVNFTNTHFIIVILLVYPSFFLQHWGLNSASHLLGRCSTTCATLQPFF
jgi:hypothetical protein